MPKYSKVGHVHLNVSDLQKSLKFYTEILGFHVSGMRLPDKAWLSFAPKPPDQVETFHELALTMVPNKNPDYWATTGLNHAAYEMESPQDVRALADEVRSKGVEIFRGPATHKGDLTYHIYVRDPDGNALEIYAKTTDKDVEFRSQIEAAVPEGYSPYKAV
jgi:catechol-2,3-dioxygenase